MDHLEDDTLADFTEIVDKDFYYSKSPSEFEIYSGSSDEDEDTVTRMILESQ